MKRDHWEEYMSRKRVPPFKCPHCDDGIMRPREGSLVVNEPRFSETEHALDGWEPDWIRERFSLSMMCSDENCGEVVNLIGRTEIREVINEDGDWSYEQMLLPTAAFPALPIIKVGEEVPREVRDEIEASFLLYWADLGASANRLRASVEGILDHFKIPASKATGGYLMLNDRIKAFETIDPEHAETFHALRIVGNVGSHKGDLKREALLDAYEIYEHALDRLFVAKKLKAKMDSLKKKIIAAKGQYK